MSRKAFLQGLIRIHLTVHFNATLCSQNSNQSIYTTGLCGSVISLRVRQLPMDLSDLYYLSGIPCLENVISDI